MQKLCFILGLSFHFGGICSQNAVFVTPHCKADSIGALDSLKFYKNIQRIASRHSFTHLLYAAIFKDPPPQKTSEQRRSGQEVSKEFYKPYQGNVIGQIRIVTIDPLGKLMDDTILLPVNFLIRSVNSLHVKSRLFVIRNKLLFEEGDFLDSIKIMKSELILRQSTGIKDARISLRCRAVDNDTVNILIVVRDHLSINAELNLTFASSVLNATDNNFMGYGHILHNSLAYNPGIENSLVCTGSYTFPNIRNTSITANIYYTYSHLYRNLGLSVDRPFISHITKWAGGINLIPVNGFRIPTNYTLGANQSFLFQTDLWLGRSFSLRRNKSNANTERRLVFAGRVYDVRNIAQPGFKPDVFQTNHNSALYLAQIGFCSRSSYKSANIYRLGRKEDVPEGMLIAFTGGYQKTVLYDQLYCGLKAAAGRHILRMGHVSEKIEYGTYLRNEHAIKGVFAAEVSFLSDLLKCANWGSRVFIDFKYTDGLNRAQGESININEGNGLNGFNSLQVYGTSKSVMNLAMVFYCPYKFLEFQFAGILFAGFGEVGKTQDIVQTGPVYQTFGVGLILHNENLLLTIIKISLNYCPQTPGKASNTFLLNQSSIPDIRFGDYTLGRPDIVSYR